MSVYKSANINFFIIFTTLNFKIDYAGKLNKAIWIIYPQG